MSSRPSSRERDELIDAAIGLDGDRIHRLARTIAERDGQDVLVADVLVPTLRRIGEMWESGKLSVMHEHYASNIIRSTVGDLRRHEAPAGAERVVIACPPGELHDLPGHLFALMLAVRNLSPVVLGASTPLLAVAHAARTTHARGCIVIARSSRFLTAHATELEHLNSARQVFIAGPASESVRPNGRLARLPHDWRRAADIVAEHAAERPSDSQQA